MQNIMELAAVATLALLGCASQSRTETHFPPGFAVFGGKRVEFGTQRSPAEAGRCRQAPALDRDPLLADFEQGSIDLRAAPERRGAWFFADDGMPAGKLEPSSLTPERDGYAVSNQAFHSRIDGFSAWGAKLGFTLRYTPVDGIECPFNAEAFAGVAFVARGSGRVRVSLGLAETTSEEEEGHCRRVCGGDPGAFVFLTNEWTEYRIEWADFAQQGWGTTVRFTVRELLSIGFATGRNDQPLDLWLDNVQFLVPMPKKSSARRAGLELGASERR